MRSLDAFLFIYFIQCNKISAAFRFHNYQKRQRAMQSLPLFYQMRAKKGTRKKKKKKTTIDRQVGKRVHCL